MKTCMNYIRMKKLFLVPMSMNLIIIMEMKKTIKYINAKN